MTVLTRIWQLSLNGVANSASMHHICTVAGIYPGIKIQSSKNIESVCTKLQLQLAMKPYSSDIIIIDMCIR